MMPLKAGMEFNLLGNGFDWRRSEKWTDICTERDTVKVSGSNIIGLKKRAGLVPHRYSVSSAHGLDVSVHTNYTFQHQSKHTKMNILYM